MVYQLPGFMTMTIVLYSERNINFRKVNLFAFPAKRVRQWAPVTTAWRVLKLRVKEPPPIWRVTANGLNKQSRTADKVWSSGLGFGRCPNNSLPQKKKLPVYETFTAASDLRIRERRGVYRVWWGNLREKDHLEDSGLEGRIILKRIFKT